MHSPALPIAAVAVLVLVCAATAYQLWRDRTPATTPRHRPVTTAPAATVDEPTVEVETITYGLLDPQVSLAEVQEYLRAIGVDWDAPLTEFERHVAGAELVTA